MKRSTIIVTLVAVVVGALAFRWWWIALTSHSGVGEHPQVATATVASAAPPRVDPAVQHELSEVAVLVVVVNMPPDTVRPGDWHGVFTGQTIVVDGPKEAGTTVLMGTRLVMDTTPYFDTLSAADGRLSQSSRTGVDQDYARHHPQDKTMRSDDATKWDAASIRSFLERSNPR